MRVASWALVLLIAAVLVGQTSAARLFDQKGLKRTIVTQRRSRKDVDADVIGRAAFDPHVVDHELWNADELNADDLGLANDVHDPTTTLVQQRLRELFPKIDLNNDGAISTEELQHHLFVNGLAMAKHRTNRDFDALDKDHDGKVTAADYLDGLYEDDEEGRAKKAEVEHGFMLADIDRDGGLNQDEFFDYLNPEEGHNYQLKIFRLQHDMVEHLGSDYHGEPAMVQMNFDQFYHHLWPQFNAWEDHGEDDNAAHWSEERDKQKARRKFVLLDVTADDLLSPDELLPAFADIHPTESRYARTQAEHMLEMVNCKDDRLTLDQMLAVPHAFYGVVHNDDEDHIEL